MIPGFGMATSANGELAALANNACVADSSVEHKIGSLQEQRAVDTVRMEEGGGVPHQLLDANFLHVAVTAVNLERPGGNLPGCLGRHGLGQGSQRFVPALILVIGQPAGITARGAISALPIFIFSLENSPSSFNSHSRS